MLQENGFGSRFGRNPMDFQNVSVIRSHSVSFHRIAAVLDQFYLIPVPKTGQNAIRPVKS